MKRFLTLLLMIAIFCTLVIGLMSCKSEEEKLVDQPTEEYVIECLRKVPYINEIVAVTEDTDPIGQLNKPKWYVASVYFSYELIDQDEVYGKDLLDKGTDAGGCIEVFKTEKDAKNREEYLASFDGTVLTSGSHTVIGTVVVRTSNELTLSQQKLLESNIIASLQGKNEQIAVPNVDSDKDNTDTSINTDTNVDENTDTNNKLPTIEELKLKAISDAEKLVNEYEADSSAWTTPVFVVEYLCNMYGYSEEIALYAIENGNIDWVTQAQKYANNYLVYEEEFGSPAVWIPYEDIEDMLYQENFSYDVVNEVMFSIDWDEQIVKYMQHLSDYYDDFNRHQAENILDDILANEDGINYVLENSDINWEKHALVMANNLWEEYKNQYYEEETEVIESIREELYLIWEFTNEEIEYAINGMNKQ